MITIASVPLYFILSLVFLFAAQLIVSHVYFFQKLIQKQGEARYKSLDGLRGFLAVGVFFHHAVINYYYFQTGDWKAPPSTLYDFLGQGAVSLFFMITGFLFWSKAMAGSALNLKKFYSSRVLRVYPMYLATLAAIILILLAMSNFSLNINWLNLVRLGKWVLLGPQGFNTGINNLKAPLSLQALDASIINAKVYWTLVYELVFYLIFPLLALFVKPLRFLGLCSFILILYYFKPSHIIAITLNFLFGMAAAYVVNRFQLAKFFSHWIFSVSTILLLALVPAVFQRDYIYNIRVITLIFAVFLPIVHGNNLFGLLTTTSAKYLGTISYSIYLLHGIVLFVTFNVVDHFCSIKGMQPSSFWLLTGVAGLVVVCLSGVTFRFIEHPFMIWRFPSPPSSTPSS